MVVADAAQPRAGSSAGTTANPPVATPPVVTTRNLTLPPVWVSRSAHSNGTPASNATTAAPLLTGTALPAHVTVVIVHAASVPVGGVTRRVYRPSATVDRSAPVGVDALPSPTGATVSDRTPPGPSTVTPNVTLLYSIATRRAKPC